MTVASSPAAMRDCGAPAAAAPAPSGPARQRSCNNFEIFEARARIQASTQERFVIESDVVCLLCAAKGACLQRMHPPVHDAERVAVGHDLQDGPADVCSVLFAAHAHTALYISAPCTHLLPMHVCGGQRRGSNAAPMLPAGTHTRQAGGECPHQYWPPTETTRSKKPPPEHSSMTRYTLCASSYAALNWVMLPWPPCAHTTRCQAHSSCALLRSLGNGVAGGIDAVLIRSHEECLLAASHAGGAGGRRRSQTFTLQRRPKPAISS